MTGTERAVRLVGVWLAVYPSVTAMSYLIEWLQIDWPIWGRILVTTAITVPLITYLAIPLIEWGLARSRHQSRADLKHEEARDLDG